MNMLREARRAAGLTAYQLAQAAGSREQRIYAFERDRYRPGPEEARRLAVALGADVVEMFPDVFKGGKQ